MKVLASHLGGLGSNPGVNTMWVEFVVGSLPGSEKFFSEYSGFFSPQKPTLPNPNSIRNQVDEEPLCGCAASKSLFIYFICTNNLAFTIEYTMYMILQCYNTPPNALDKMCKSHQPSFFTLTGDLPL